jgi:hypothetical protein
MIFLLFFTIVTNLLPYRMLARRREAEISIDLMKETFRRNVEDEENKKGLIITKSIYGRWLDLSHRDLGDAITDVTIPLQCLVRDSKLILQEASKVGVLQNRFQKTKFLNKFFFCFITVPASRFL